MIKDFTTLNNKKVIYESDEEINEQTVEAITKWCSSHNITSGADLMNKEKAYSHAPDLVATIIDYILKFEI